MAVPDATGDAAVARPVPLDIRTLLEARAYPHPVTELRLVETHISWVVLTGVHAYKIKKPVNLGFLDFSTLELRRRACLDELRLNRRLAPQLYLEVVPITGPLERPAVAGDGPPIEYAVRMREFAQEAQLDRLLDAGRLEPQDIDALAIAVARFHAAAPTAPPDSPFGRPAEVQRPVYGNLAALLAGTEGATRAAVARLAAWAADRDADLGTLMEQRRREGFVREVHGDLHLANLVKLESGIAAFDCIEFSEALRWLDVVSDLAFATMDLRFRGREDLAYRLLNRYLEASGDYAGLRLLRYYEVYRALVRAKIALLRRSQLAASEQGAPSQALDAYVGLARRLSTAGASAVILMHGFSGSGKSRLSEVLMTTLPALRLRSDIERKRLHGLRPGEASGSSLMGGIYSAAVSERTYAHLAAAAAAILDGGETVVVDAAFLRRADRDRFRQLARRRGLAFAIVSCEAPVAELQRRIAERARLGTDASEADQAVLERQLATAEPLDEEERRSALIVATADAPASDVAAGIAALLQRRVAAAAG